MRIANSIRFRLQQVIVVTTASLLAFACAVFIFLEWRNSLAREKETALTIARITADASTAIMSAMGTPAEAEKQLRALRAEPGILEAALYTPAGKLFAEYHAGRTHPPAQPRADGPYREKDRFEVFWPVIENGKRFGTFYLQTDLQGLYRRMGQYAEFALVIFLSALAGSFLIGQRLQGTVSSPILALADAAQRISRRRDYSVRVPPVKGGELEILTHAFNQMLEEIQAQQRALVHEKELLATTLSSIGDAVIVTDAGGRITFLNAQAESLTGWASSQAKAQLLPEVFRIINEETRHPVENPVNKVLRLGQVVGLANHTTLIAKDGSERPIDDSAAPIRQPDGPLLGVVLVFRDFTERRQAEAALREAHAELASRAVQLEKLVSERTSRLQEMVNELQHVSYAIVHDMRAPLRAMNTFATVIQEEIAEAGKPSPQLLDYCNRIITAATRLDHLIQDSLSYTKSVLQEVRLRPVDLNRLIPDIIATYPNLDPDKADITIEHSLPVVLGEESLLTQCFSNLLGNAVKFVPPGVRPQVRLKVHLSENLARIIVQDNGIGIPLQAQSRLFGMFQRLTSQYEGTGIGLAIVRKVAERMGGKVGVESEPGKGSQFWVELTRA